MAIVGKIEGVMGLKTSTFRAKVKGVMSSLGQLGRKFRKTGAEAKKAEGLMSKFGAAAKASIGLALVATIAKVTVATFKMGAAFKDAKVAFDQSGASLDEFRTATSGLVSDFDLVTKFNLAKSLGVTEDAFKALSAAALASARSTGQSAQFLFESAITGAARQSPMILDNLGIKIKKTGDRAKFMSQLLSEANRIVAESGDIALSASAKYAQFEVKMKNLQTSVGSLGDTIATNLGKDFLTLTDGMGIGLSKVDTSIEGIVGGFRQWGEEAQEFQSSIVSLIVAPFQAMVIVVLKGLDAILKAMDGFNLASAAVNNKLRAAFGMDPIKDSGFSDSIDDARDKIQGLQKDIQNFRMGDFVKDFLPATIALTALNRLTRTPGGGGKGGTIPPAGGGDTSGPIPDFADFFGPKAIAGFGLEDDIKEGANLLTLQLLFAFKNGSTEAAKLILGAMTHGAGALAAGRFPGAGQSQVGIESPFAAGGRGGAQADFKREPGGTGSRAAAPGQFAFVQGLSSATTALTTLGNKALPGLGKSLLELNSKAIKFVISSLMNFGKALLGVLSSIGSSSKSLQGFFGAIQQNAQLVVTGLIAFGAVLFVVIGSLGGIVALLPIIIFGLIFFNGIIITLIVVLSALATVVAILIAPLLILAAILGQFAFFAGFGLVFAKFTDSFERVGNAFDQAIKNAAAPLEIFASQLIALAAVVEIVAFAMAEIAAAFGSDIPKLLFQAAVAIAVTFFRLVVAIESIRIEIAEAFGRVALALGSFELVLMQAAIGLLTFIDGLLQAVNGGKQTDFGRGAENLQKGADEAAANLTTLSNSLDDTSDVMDSALNAIDQLTNLTFTSAMRRGNELADQFKETSDAASEFGEELTNVPEGFKVTLARFRATVPGLGDPDDPGNQDTGGAPVTFNGPVNVFADDPRGFLDALQNMANGRSLQQTGSIGGDQFRNGGNI